MSTKEFTNPMRQTGWMRDIDLNDATGIGRETLLDWMLKDAITHKRPGTRAFIHMEKFYTALPDGSMSPLSKNHESVESRARVEQNADK